MDDTLLEKLTRGTHLMNAPDQLLPPPADDEASRLRVPPHSNEAEQSVLGGLLIDPGAFTKISDSLTLGDFYAHSHRLIFGAIVSMLGEGKPVDIVTVYERLGDQNERTGGLSYLNALAQCVPGASNIARYAEIVIERSTRRSIIAAAEQATTRAFSAEGNVAQLLDDAKVAFGRIGDQRKLGTTRIPVLGLAQLRELAHSLSWIVKGVINSDSMGMLYGASGSFKSFLAVDGALHVAHGLPWMGRKTKQGAVVFIAAEGGSGLWGRIVAWHRARRLQMGDVPFYVIPVAVDLGKDSWRVVEAIQALGITPLLVVVDTLSQTYSGEENSANEVAGYFREVGTRIRALWHCAVMFIHHSGHNATERPRGSSVMRANLDWMLGVFRDEKEMLATLTCGKVKDGDPFNDATFAVTQHELGTDEDGDKVNSLVARHLSSAEELQDAMERESSAGRGGANQLLLGLLQNGAKEQDVRKAFYEQCGKDTPEARRQAYHRARKWAEKNGFMEVAEGYVLTLKSGGNS